MKRISLIFILFLISSMAASAKKYYSPSKALPSEFRFLVESIQTYDLNQDEKNFIKDQVIKLDNVLSVLKRREFFFLIKSEIYKGLLRHKPDFPLQDTSFTPNIISSLQEILKKKEDFKPFTRWLLAALISDLDQLFRSSVYPEFMRYRNLPNYSAGPDVKRMQKKFELLLPWVEFTRLSGPKGLEEILKPVMLEVLALVTFYGKTTLDYSRFSAVDIEIPKQKLVYFDYRIFNPKLDGQDFTLEEIIDSVLEKHKKSGLPLPVDDWTPREHDFANKKAPAPIPTPDPDYKAPAKLPSPINDWIFEF